MIPSNVLRVPAGALLLVLALLAVAAPADAQKRDKTDKGIPLEKGAIRALRFPNLPKPPMSAAWENPESVARGAEMMERLMATAGGWEAFQSLGGVRYDMLETSRMDSGKGKDPWVVHHYKARLVYLNTDGNGYVYSEFARPSLQGPDFVREVRFDDVSWREMRGNFGRSPKAMRTARSSVRLEYFTGAMPFSLKGMNAKLAYIRTEPSEMGDLEVYAVQLEEPLIVNYFPFMVDEYGTIDEHHLYVLAGDAPQVVQMRFAFPDHTITRPPHLRWWTMDFEGRTELATPDGEGKVYLPHKRFRWLDGFNDIEELWCEDHVVGRIPAEALRRPWLTSGLYAMPYRCDYWDPPEGVDGLEGHGTGTPVLPRGEYPPGHPRHVPKTPAPEAAGEGDGAKGGS